MKKYGVVLLLLLVSLYSSRSLLAGQYVPTHDGEYHIIRFWQFDKMIRSGFLFPRWAPDLNNGYGVPLFQFFYPLPNYIGELFHIVGFSFVRSVHLVLASGLIISALTCYAWMRCFFDRKSSLISSILYLLAPYHLVDVFVRGSVGEVWALAIGPFVLYAATKLIHSKIHKQMYFVLLSIFSSILLLAHTVVGAMIFLFTVSYTVVLWWQQKQPGRKLIVYGLGYAIGLLFTAFFFVPIIAEQQFVRGLDIVNYQDHFPDLFQLIIPSWGSGFSVPGISDQISFQIGVVQLFTLVVSIFLLIRQRSSIGLYMFFVCFVSIFLMLEVSRPIWEIVSFLRYFQYPWRILSLVILTSSHLVGYLLHNRQWYLTMFILFFGLLLYLPYTNAVTYEKREDSYYLSNPNWTRGTATLGNSFNTMWFTPQDPTDRIFSSADTTSAVEETIINPVQFSATIQSQDSADLFIHKSYFPGWRATVDGVNIPTSPTDTGLISVLLPEGNHSILISLENTPARTIGTIVTVLGIIILLLITRIDYLWK